MLSLPTLRSPSALASILLCSSISLQRILFLDFLGIMDSVKRIALHVRFVVDPFLGTTFSNLWDIFRTVLFLVVCVVR